MFSSGDSAAEASGVGQGADAAADQVTIPAEPGAFKLMSRSKRPSGGRQRGPLPWATNVVARYLHNAVHDAISRRPGNFAPTARGLGNLCARGGVVSGKVVISRLNQGHLVGIVRLLARIGVKRCNMAFPHGVGNARR